MSKDPTPLIQASIVLRRVTSLDDPAFQRLVDIYIEAHPASERKSLGQLSAMFQQPDYLFEVIFLANTVVGFAIITQLPYTDACLLEYMAITKGKRGLGLGSSLFRHIVRLPEVAPRFLLAEVDSDREPSGERAERVRRKRFYRHLGCKEVAGLEYIMPPVSSRPPPVMNVMAFRRELPREVSKEQLRGWLQAIYVNVYGQLPTDGRIDEMLKSISTAAELV